MKIYAKIGTMPALVYHVCRKKKLPQVGEIVELTRDDMSGKQEERVIIEEIHSSNSINMFIAARM